MTRVVTLMAFIAYVWVTCTNTMSVSLAPDTAAVVLGSHECWTADPPADMMGRIPGHAVVRARGRVVYAGGRMVHEALEQVFDGYDYGLTVYGFCR